MIEKEYKLEKLKKAFIDADIDYWVNKYGVNCHIFTIQIKSEAQLKKIWEPITNKIAIDFQAEFEDEYESWNVYAVFISKCEISRKLKYEIENDKYSSRKIVMDEIDSNIDEDGIKEKILNRIFQFDIAEKPRDKAKKNKKQDLSRILDNKLFPIISKVIFDGKDDSDKRKRLFRRVYKEYINEEYIK